MKDLATHTPGTVVAPGTILLTLVPHDEPLVAEVWVNNIDSGFVRAEQKARVKLAAHPFLSGLSSKESPYHAVFV